MGSGSFRVKFVPSNGLQRTEAMTVHGDYTRGYDSTEETDGQGVLDKAEEKGRDFMASQGTSGKGIIAAFDLTDVWRDERFNADCGVVVPDESHFRHGYKEA